MLSSNNHAHWNFLTHWGQVKHIGISKLTIIGSGHENCGCLVTWFCYQLIAKPGNKTAAVSWPDPLVQMMAYHLVGAKPLSESMLIVNWTLGMNFSEITLEFLTFSFKKMHLEMPSGKWHPFCLGLTVLFEGLAYPFQVKVFFIVAQIIWNIILALDNKLWS